MIENKEVQNWLEQEEILGVKIYPIRMLAEALKSATQEDIWSEREKLGDLIHLLVDTIENLNIKIMKKKHIF